MNAFSAMVWDACAEDSRRYIPAGMPNWRKALRCAELIRLYEEINAATANQLINELDQQIYEATR